MRVPAKNPVPTAGDLRLAWSRAQEAVRPGLPYLRRGVYVGVGLGVAVFGLATFREPAQRGEDVVWALRTRPVAAQATDTVNERGQAFAASAERTADDTHDLIEETYGRVDQMLDVVWHNAALALRKINPLARIAEGRAPR